MYWHSVDRRVTGTGEQRVVMPDDVWVYECETAATALSTAAVAPPLPLWRRVRAAVTAPYPADPERSG